MVHVTNAHFPVACVFTMIYYPTDHFILADFTVARFGPTLASFTYIRVNPVLSVGHTGSSTFREAGRHRQKS